VLHLLDWTGIFDGSQTKLNRYKRKWEREQKRSVIKVETAVLRGKLTVLKAETRATCQTIKAASKAQAAGIKATSRQNLPMIRQENFALGAQKYIDRINQIQSQAGFKTPKLVPAQMGDRSKGGASLPQGGN